MKNQESQSLALMFNGTNLMPIAVNNQFWLTSVDLAKCLGYTEPDSVTKIYNRNKDEFTDAMTVLRDGQTDHLGEFRGLQRKQRIFSLRGCYSISFFARTAIAKDFRKWVLDIIDQSTQVPYGLNSVSISPELQYKKNIEDKLVKLLHNFAETSDLSDSAMNYFLHEGFFKPLKITTVSELTVGQINRAIAQLEKATDLSDELKVYIKHISSWLLFGLTSDTDYYSGLPSGVAASIRGMYRI